MKNISGWINSVCYTEIKTPGLKKKKKRRQTDSVLIKQHVSDERGEVQGEVSFPSIHPPLNMQRRDLCTTKCDSTAVTGSWCFMHHAHHH